MSAKYNQHEHPRLNLIKLAQSIGDSTLPEIGRNENWERLVSKLLFKVFNESESDNAGFQAAIDALPESIIVKKTAAEIATLTLAKGVFSYATDTDQLTIHDGVTSGGNAIGGGGGLESVAAVTFSNVDTSSAPADIEGVTPENDDLVILGGQSIGTENGIYVWAGVGNALLRASAYSQSSQFEGKGLVFYNEDENVIYSTTNPVGYDLSTTPLVFAQTTATFANITNYVAAQYQDFEVASGTDVDTVKEALDQLASIQNAKVREDTDANVYSEPRTRIIRNTETDELFVVIGDGATSKKYRLDTKLDPRTARIPGANADQSIHPHLSSPDGGVVAILRDQSVVGDTKPYKLFFYEPDGTRHTVSEGISAVFDKGETAFDVEYRDDANDVGLGAGEEYSLITGDSDSTGANGLPIIQCSHPADAGANPYPLVHGGRGDSPKGKLAGKKVGILRGYLDQMARLKEDSQKGELGMDSTANAGTITLKEGSFWVDSVTAIADNTGIQYTVSDTSDLQVGDTVRVSGLTQSDANGDHKIASIESGTQFTSETAYTAGAGADTGSVYALGRVAYTSPVDDTYANIYEKAEPGVYLASDNDSIVVVAQDGTYRQFYAQTRTAPIPGATPEQQVVPHLISPTGDVLQSKDGVVEVIRGDGKGKATLGAVIIETGEGYDADSAFDVDGLMGLGAAEEYSYITGNSDTKGANGIPVIQGLHAPAAGANQPRQMIGSGRDVKGPQVLRVPIGCANYRGDIDEFLKIAQDGEICLNDTASVIVGVTAPAGKFYGCVKDAGRLIDGTDRSVPITASADNAGDIQFTCTATDLTVLVNVDDIVFVSGTDGDASEAGQHKVKAVTATTITVETNWHAGVASTTGDLRLDALVEALTSTTI